MAIEENMRKGECGNYELEDGEIFIVNLDVTLPYIVRVPSIIILQREEDFSSLYVWF